MEGKKKRCYCENTLILRGVKVEAKEKKKKKGPGCCIVAIFGERRKGNVKEEGGSPRGGHGQ